MSCTKTKDKSMKLPDYVVINNEDLTHDVRKVLRTEAQTLHFPLSEEDKESVRLVEAKFDQEEKIAGLAAPQIGIAKKIIVFVAPDDEEFKKWRTDLTQTMPKTIWINASYVGISEDKRTYYEGCFSVHNIAGEVPRFTKIKYSAYTPDGELVEGEAEGYLARVIQHEVDHTNGKLFIDYVEPGKCVTMEEYFALRKAAMPNEGN